MKISIRTQGFEQTAAIRAHIESQLKMNMANFSESILSINVSLSDINGPKGGPDKRALICVRLVSRLSVTSECTRTDLYAAVTQSARQAKRSVKRTLNKHRRMEKYSLRDMDLSLID